ncbi:MAG: WxcM-like domain-containing protein [Firmicutes bacterium]|nr:WxcM-like domain-containing protein [Bacillota bacterium]
MTSRAIIHEGVEIGQDVVLGDYVVVYPGAQIDNNCIVEGFTQIWSGVRIREGVRLGPGVIFERSNSFMPFSEFANIDIGAGAKIGAGVIINQGLSIGEGAVIVPGAMVAQNVPPYAIVSGSPARVTGYVESVSPHIDGVSMHTVLSPGELVKQVGVGGVTLHRLKLVCDPRGDLVVGEIFNDVPFEVKRFFLVFNVPNEKTRGEHAHIKCHQFLICVKGTCCVVVDDGTKRCEVALDSQNIGIHLPPLTWGIQYKYSPEAVLLVFASAAYDPNDYIRNYAEFVKLIKSQGRVDD